MTEDQWNQLGFPNDAVVEILFENIPEYAHPLNDGWVNVTLHGAEVVPFNNESCIHIRMRSGIVPPYLPLANIQDVRLAKKNTDPPNSH